MSKFTVEETNLMCIYHIGTREGLVLELTQVQEYLEQDETELLELTQSVVDKLRDMNDDEFDRIIAELFFDFG